MTEIVGADGLPHRIGSAKLRIFLMVQAAEATGLPYKIGSLAAANDLDHRGLLQHIRELKSLGVLPDRRLGGGRASRRRLCLGCRRPFLSAGPLNRLCNACHARNAGDMNSPLCES